jgi:uncharacterized protein (DUF488 family)
MASRLILKRTLKVHLVHVNPPDSPRAGTGVYPIHTIGHSTRTVDELVALLEVGGVTTVVDIRSVPRSRTNPQFNLDSLPGALAGRGLGHVFLPELGGLRGKSKTVPPEVNAFWTNKSFHNYADHALSAGFRLGLDRLLALGREGRCAIMCSEAVWWRCHRRIVADYLIAGGTSVLHLMWPDRVEPARLTEAALRGGGGLVYPAASSAENGIDGERGAR